MNHFAREPGWFSEKPILLLTINAKWIHPSLALRLLKANMGHLENRCEITELNLRQDMAEKLKAVISAKAGILGISVSIWNHNATLELLKELENIQAEKPVVVLGGPEVSHLPPDAEIFRYANYVIRGEGEIEFGTLCQKLLTEGFMQANCTQFICAQPVKPDEINNPAASSGVLNPSQTIKSAYQLYSEEDLAKKLIYVESSRGCPFNCDFCLSAVKMPFENAVREFPLEPFLAQMDDLVKRGTKTFKFLDRTFNINIKRSLKIMDFFLDKIEKRKGQPLTVHFEMVPFLFPGELLETITRFPPGTLRLEIGFQTFNPQTASLIGIPRPMAHTGAYDPEHEMKILRFLCERTNAIIHADLIAGLPAEDIVSFGNGFDRLWGALAAGASDAHNARAEIQAGILKLLPGAPISRHSEAYGMRYNPAPPYEVIETSALCAGDLQRLKNFARFWEIIVNRKLMPGFSRYYGRPVFSDFMALSDSLAAHFGRNWGIDKNELKKMLEQDNFFKKN